MEQEARRDHFPPVGADWSRDEWNDALVEMTRLQNAGDWKACLQLADAWRLFWSNRQSGGAGWHFFIRQFQPSRGEPEKVLPWRCLRALMEALSKAHRDADMAIVAAVLRDVAYVEPEPFCIPLHYLDLQLEDYMRVTELAFNATLLTKRAAAQRLLESAAELLEFCQEEDAAIQLRRLGRFSETAWQELSDREREIIEVLASKGQLKAAAIADGLSPGSGSKLNAEGIKNQLSRLMKADILDNASEGYWIRQFPLSTPARITSLRPPE